MALSASQKAAASKTLAKAKSQLTKLNKDFNAGKKSNGGKGYSQEFLSSATDKLKSANKTASSISKNLSRRPITPEDMSVDPGVVEMPKPVVPVNQGLDLNFNNAVVAPNGVNGNMLEVVPFNASQGAGANETAAVDSMNALGSQINQFLGIARPDEGANEMALLDARRQAGVDAAQREFNRYSQQLNAITAKRDADILSLEGQGRGITDVIIGGQQARINRDAAIQALPIQAQLAAAQGNLEQANVLMGQLYQAKSADIQADLTYRTNLVNSVIGFATTAQSAILQGAIADNAAKAAQAQSNLEYQRQLSLQALEFGQNGLIGGIASLDPNSPTFEQDIAAYTAQLRKPVAAGSIKAPELQNFGTSDNPVWRQFNTATGQWEPVEGIDGLPMEQAQQVADQLGKYDFLLDTITEATSLTDFSGPTPVGEFLRKNIYGSDTGAVQLQNQIDTLKVNLLTMQTDPLVKEFFGPQMSDNDSRLMLSGGSTLDAYRNTPEQNRKELQRYNEMINRAKIAVAEGLKQRYAQQAYAGNLQLGADGQMYVIIDEE